MQDNTENIATRHEHLPLELRYDDDPRVVAAQLKEEYTSHVVPLSARLSRAKIAGSWWSNASAMVLIFYGALSAYVAGTQQAILGLALASITMALLSIRFAKAAIRTGLSSSLISRRIFGFRGANLTVALIAMGAIYFAVVEGTLMAKAFEQWTGVGSILLWGTVVVAIIVPLALGGMQTWLSKVSAAFLPVYVVGILVAVIVAAVHSDSPMSWWSYAGEGTGSSLPGWLVVYVMYMGTWLLLVDQIDFARFGRERDVKFHGRFSFGWAFFFVAFFVNGLIGIYLARTVTPDATPSEAGIVTALLHTLGFFGLVTIVVSQLRINVVNVYIASLNLSRLWSELFAKRLGRAVSVFLVGIVVFLLMLTDVLGYISIALGWLAIVFVAWVSIYFTQAVYERIAKIDEIEFRASRVPNYGLGLISWFAAAGSGILLIEIPNIPETVSGLAPLYTLAVSVVVHGALLAGRHGRRKEISRSDLVRANVPNLWSTWVKCQMCLHSYIAAEMDQQTNDPSRPVCLECATSAR